MVTLTFARMMVVSCMVAAMCTGLHAENLACNEADAMQCNEVNGVECNRTCSVEHNRACSVDERNDASDVERQDAAATARPDREIARICPEDAVMEVDTLCPAIPAISADGEESVVARHYRNYAMRPCKRPFIMDLLVGPAISLGSHGGHYDWAGPRPNAINWFKMRFAYYPLHHWGIYYSIGWSTYKPREYWSDLIGQPLVDQADSGCFYSGTWLNGIGELGLSYQVQYRRWAIQARAGYGVYSMGRGTAVRGVYNEVDEYGYGSDPVLEVCRHIWTRNLSFSMIFGYRLSRICNIVLDIGYRHPFNRPVGWVSTYDDVPPAGWRYDSMHMWGATGETKFGSSTPWGRDLSLSVGIQLITDTARRPKDKATPSYRRPFTPPRFHHRK